MYGLTGKGALARCSGFIPYLVILTGFGLLTLAVAVDFVGLGREAGFGGKQARLAIFGLVILLVGIGLTPAVKHRFVLRWLMPSSEYELPVRAAVRPIARILLIAA